MIFLFKYVVVLAIFVASAWLTSHNYGGVHLRTQDTGVTNLPPFKVENDIFSRHSYPSRRLSNPVLNGGTVTPEITDDHHNATDDGHESTGHSSGHPSLFEALSAIHVEIGTYSVLVIIGFIIILKQIIEGLYAFTHESPFHGMVKKIEEELMIVGTSSFIFKVVLNTTTFGNNVWAYPLEFGEVLIPLVAFSYCGIGIFLIMVSFKQCYTWSRAHNLKVMEILDDYYTASKTWYFSLTWKPMNKSIEQMEFRIFHNIFCSTFKIQKEAFAFDEYVAKVFQRSVLELIEIRLLDWFYVTVLLLLNLARVKLNLNINDCQESDITECDAKRTVRLFTLAGTIIFLFTFLLLLASRRLECTIMGQKGPKSHTEYANFLKAEEEKEKIDYMNLDQLKVAAAKAKEKEKESHDAASGHMSVGSHRSTIAVLSNKIASSRSTLIMMASPSGKSNQLGNSRHQGAQNSTKVAPIDEHSSRNTSNKAPSDPVTSSNSSRIVQNSHNQEGQVEMVGNTAIATTTAGATVSNVEGPESKSDRFTPAQTAAVSTPPQQFEVLRPSMMQKMKVAEGDPSDSDVSSEDLAGGEEEQIGDLPTFASRDRAAEKEDFHRSAEATSAADQGASSPRLNRPSQISAIHDLTFGEHSMEAKEMFWFGKPELHFESVQILFMVISLYAALWLTVIVSLNNSEWRFLSIAPAILILIFFFYIVKTAALLKAVYVVDTDALLEVIEETEAAKQLSLELRERVLQRLELSGEDPFEEIQRLYNEIDINRSDSLSRSEFGQFMELMGISFSVKKWEKIFKEVDRNYDNEISLNEFLLFLYPDHDVALSMENKRLKIISQRVMDRASNLMHQLAPLTDIVGITSTDPLTHTTTVVGSHHPSTVVPVPPTPGAGAGGAGAGTTAASTSSTSHGSAAARRASIPKIHPVMIRQSSSNSNSNSVGHLSRNNSTTHNV